MANPLSEEPRVITMERCLIDGCRVFINGKCSLCEALGFHMIEILLVYHGGGHNDTIVTVERKMNSSLEAFDVSA
jgi:hypothetical protein